MRIPADWDKPGEDNAALCELFQYGAYEDPSMKIKYRYFVPRGAAGASIGGMRPLQGAKAAEENIRLETGEFPLVLYLHGADAFGNDNEAQIAMHDVGTMFARPYIQEPHPCFVLAPQTRGSRHWSSENVSFALQSAVLDFVKKHQEIDKRRIYVYGYSAGGAGTLRLIKRFTDYYAAAISICGATGGAFIEKLLDTPLYMIHAADDEIVRSTYGESRFEGPSHYGSRDIYERFKNASIGGKPYDIKYVEYPAGWMKENYGINPHCTWVPVSDANRNQELVEWLFSHVSY